MTRKNENIDRERYLLLKGMLEDRRREIHEKLRSLREAIPAASHDVRDAEEQSVDEFVQEVDLALMQMKSDTLKKIDAAILRLEDGSYGRCGECEQEISAARLRALPFAVLCRDCLVHLSFAHIERAVDNLRRSGATWLVTTTFTGWQTNSDCDDGDWRALNLCRPPFGWPAPAALIDEHCDEAGGGWRDKSLGVWPLAAL